MNWSYSRYGTWKKCPALLKFQAESESTVQHPAAVRGQAIHKLIEDYIRGEDVPFADKMNYYKTFFDELRKEGAKPELPIALNANWEVCEWDDPNRWWRGILDCVVEYDTHAVIYDWKTGKEYPDHREQREIYAAAYHALKPVDFIRVFHTYVDTRQTTYTMFHREDIPELRKKWEDRVAPMLADTTFAPNPGYYCRFCAFSREVGGPCQF